MPIWTVLATALFLAAAPPSLASFRAEHTDAVLLIPSRSISEPIEDAEFSIMLWIRPDDDGDGQLLQILDDQEDVIVSLDRSTADGVRASVGRNAATSLIASDLTPGEWSLVALSVEDDLARLFVATEGAGVVEDHAIIDPEDLPDDASLVRLGAGDGEAVTGLYGLVAVRDHPLSRADVEAIANSTDFLAAFRRDDTSDERQINGTGGVAWMVGHAMSTRPRNRLGSPSSTSQRAAVVGEAVTRFNTHVYDRDAPSGSDTRAVRDVEAAHGFTHVSPFGDGRFTPVLPTLDKPLPPEAVISGRAPAARSLLGEPDALTRVVVSANSRAVQRNDGSFERSGNYADGFIATLGDRVAGVLLRPAATNRHPWAAFCTIEGSPWRSGLVSKLGDTDFARFFTGSVTGNGPGPGDGLALSPDSGFILRTAPFARAAADAPLVVRAHLLSYPGAASIRWTPNHHTRQGAPGQDVGPPIPLSLDTTIYTHVFDPAAGDQLDASALTIAAPLPMSVEPGHAVAHADGIALIGSIEFDGANSTITLAHPWQAPPNPNDELRFGSWSLVTIEHEWAPVAGERDWRGLKIETDPTGWPVPVFAFDAWNPDASGFLIGTAGWGGNGYDVQLDQATPAATSAWMALTEANVWLQVFAQQESTPESMLRYTDAIRAALPAADVLWLGESEHGTGASEQWHRYILENAEAAGVPAISLLLDPRFGGLDDQIAAGLRSNANHYSAAGVDTLAEAWIERLAEAALPADADLDGDGLVGATDLATLIAAWGLCEGPCPADLDGDRVVGPADLAALVASWN